MWLLSGPQRSGPRFRKCPTSPVTLWTSGILACYSLLCSSRQSFAQQQSAGVGGVPTGLLGSLVAGINHQMSSGVNSIVPRSAADSSNNNNSRRYTAYGNGVVDNPDLMTAVSSGQECAAICAGAGQTVPYCSAYSVRFWYRRAVDGVRRYECRIAAGDYTWTPDPEAVLAAEDIGHLRGYTFARDGKFYRHFTVPGLSWSLENATKLCFRDEATLAVPYPKAQWQAVASVTSGVRENHTSFFVGVFKVGTSAEGRWITIDGTSFLVGLRSSDINQLWGPNEPDGIGDALMVTTPGHRFDDVLSSETVANSVLCRRDTLYKMSPVNGKYYRMYAEKKNWIDAAATCKADGGTLANVYTLSDFQALASYRLLTKGLVRPWLEGFWVGGTDAFQEGTWVFPDSNQLDSSGQLLVDFTQTSRQLWMSGEPNGGPEENCMAMSLEGAGDFRCQTQVFRFLCEIQVTSESAPQN